MDHAHMTATPKARALALLIGCAAVTAAVLVWFQSTDVPGSRVVGDSSSRAGWKTVEYGPLMVDIPSTWERLDMSECGLPSERWAGRGSSPCHFDGGVGFQAGDTFDPAQGPGVTRTTVNGGPTWGGYVRLGGVVV